MKYKLITAEGAWYTNTQEDLENRVNEFLKRGWRLQGGVSVSSCVGASYRKRYIMSQAMILEEDKPASKSELHVNMR